MRFVTTACLCMGFALAVCVGTVRGADPVPEERPNILWITIEDWSPDLSCYGTKGIRKTSKKNTKFEKTKKYFNLTE